MTVRDLGYRAYEGALLPPSHNTWVMLRYGLWRIWGSWLNKLVVFFFWLPVALLAILAAVRFMAVGPEVPEVPEGTTGFAAWFMAEPAIWMRTLMGIQFWFFATLVTIRSGAGVIAEDLTNKAYQFYFAKPVTPIQYLAGRTSALAVFLFMLLFIPALLLVGVMIGVGPEEQRLERLGLLLPALMDSAIVSLATAILSVAVSALSRSRALTLTAWVVLLFVPFVLATLVDEIGDVEWVYAASLPGVLWSVGDSLYKVSDRWEHLEWFHTAPVLVIAVAGASYLTWQRIGKAEVIT